MMAAILSLFLLIISSLALADNSDWPDFSAVKNIDLLQSKTKALSGRDLSTYRGGINRLMNNTVLVYGESGIGSGVVLSDLSANKLGLSNQLQEFDKLIVTNFHVVEAPDNYKVAFYPQTSDDLDDAPFANATLLSVLPKKDLALLGVKGDFNLYLGADINIDELSINVGDDVEAIGHPHSNLWSYTRGYVSQIRQDYEWSYSSSDYKAKVIQTQTPINGGNSGGPLFDSTGVVVGINSFGDDNAQGLNFAISASELLNLKGELTKTYEAIDEWNYWNDKSLDDLAYELSLEYNLIGSELLDSSSKQKIHFFDLGDDGLEDMLVFADEQGYLVFAFYSEDSQRPNIFFTLNHQNHSAVFLVSIDEEGDGEIDIEGWDFNGDFEVDFIINTG